MNYLKYYILIFRVVQKTFCYWFLILLAEKGSWEVGHWYICITSIWFLFTFHESKELIIFSAGYVEKINEQNNIQGLFPKFSLYTEICPEV